ncbi:MAG: YraN family protein [Mycobacterium sp.]|nr:YraN family protein [Mycobacterium sp.]
MAMLSRAEIGALGEQLAVDHLTSLGLRVLTRNWRCRYGELDVIAADDAGRTVVFVEVKTRTSDQFGGVSQAVTPNKVRRLRRLAGLWLAGQHGSWAAVRIDVIGVCVASTAKSWRSRPTSPPACPACISSGCPTPPSRSHATGCARRSPTAATAGRWRG